VGPTPCTVWNSCIVCAWGKKEVDVVSEGKIERGRGENSNRKAAE
jgi:hypothetical protein